MEFDGLFHDSVSNYLRGRNIKHYFAKFQVAFNNTAEGGCKLRLKLFFQLLNVTIMVHLV